MAFFSPQLLYVDQSKRKKVVHSSRSAKNRAKKSFTNSEINNEVTFTMNSHRKVVLYKPQSSLLSRVVVKYQLTEPREQLHMKSGCMRNVSSGGCDTRSRRDLLNSFYRKLQRKRESAFQRLRRVDRAGGDRNGNSNQRVGTLNGENDNLHGVSSVHGDMNIMANCSDYHSTPSVPTLPASIECFDWLAENCDYFDPFGTFLGGSSDSMVPAMGCFDIPDEDLEISDVESLHAMECSPLSSACNSARSSCPELADLPTGNRGQVEVF
jgi:hypothetical protein